MNIAKTANRQRSVINELPGGFTSTEKMTDSQEAALNRIIVNLGLSAGSLKNTTSNLRARNAGQELAQPNLQQLKKDLIALGAEPAQVETLIANRKKNIGVATDADQSKINMRLAASTAHAIPAAHAQTYATNSSAGLKTANSEKFVLADRIDPGTQSFSRRSTRHRDQHRGVQRTDFQDIVKRRGSNGGNFKTDFRPENISRGNMLILKKGHGAEIISPNINPDRNYGTYYYTSKKDALKTGVVASGFIYGNRRALEIDFDEITHRDPTRQVAGIWVNNRKVEKSYRAADLGFKNFAHQDMRYKAVISEGQAKIFAMNAKGRWQLLMGRQDWRINENTMSRSDFKPMASIWGNRHYQGDFARLRVRDMSFTPA